MGLFQKFKEGLLKTHSKLAHEIKRIVTASPRLTEGGIEDLEAALIAADLGLAMTAQIVASVKHSFETQGRAGLDVFAIARAEVEKSMASNSGAGLKRQPGA
jgi:fused signal recognition particle receptor